MFRSLKTFWLVSLCLGLIAFPRGGSLLLASQSPSHATHFDNVKGPGLPLNETGCYTCHGDKACPKFDDGEPLETTTVCNDCHSAGGTLDGVTMAKLNWEYGVYEEGGTALKSGKEMWCISCHDGGTSVCDGVSAPDISGDNTSYGYYVNGHRSKLCSDCHDLTATHIDGEARTYAFDAAYYDPDQSGVAYASGYRLGYVDGKVPLMIPANYGTTFVYDAQTMRDNAFRLCFSCHDYTKILDNTPGDGIDSNFKASLPNPPRDYSYAWGSGADVNEHVSHVLNYIGPYWDSDWDADTSGSGDENGHDSLMACSSCHNVHGAAGAEGSTNEPMIRDGSLTGRTGYGFSYVVEDLPAGGYPSNMVTSLNASLPISVGAVFRNGNAMCQDTCHQCPTPLGSSYNASGSSWGTYLEYYRPTVISLCNICHAYGTGTSHPTHDDSTGKGVDLECYVCHDSGGHVNNSIDFDDQKPLSTTEACDDCHSPGGAFDGSQMAKDNWEQGVYDEAGLSLWEGKEEWCAGCHDDDPDTLGTNESALIDGVHAPGIVGDDTAYGFYASGHGKSGTVQCLDCHDATFAHIDGEARTYEAASDNYQEGYRLNTSMRIPRIGGGAAESDFALCYKGCHHIYDDQSRFYTNFKEALYRPARNWHEEHLQSLFTGPEGQVWDSDWDGEYCGMSGGGLCADSAMSCPACHNVHGSPMDVSGTLYPNPVMIRHGELISTPGTTNKVPAFDFHWYDEGNDMTAELNASRSGGLLCASPKNLDYNHVCWGCHPTGEKKYSRVPGEGEGVITHQVWTTDLNNNPLTTFSPGDGIRYHVSFTVFGHPEYPDYVYYVKTKASGAESSDYPDAVPGSWRHVLNRNANLTENADADPYVWTWDKTIPIDSNTPALLSVKIELYGGGSDPWDKGNREESSFTIE